MTVNRNDREYSIRELRARYIEKEHTELDELKALDRTVRRPANVFAYVFGSVSALIMGSGMSLVMTDIGDKLGLGVPMGVGIAVGVVGMLMAIVNYPIYKKLLTARRRKYAPRIIALSDKLLSD